MNRGIKLLILLGVLAAVIVATLIIVKVTEPEKIPLSTVSGDTILQFDLAELDRIQWTYGEEEFDFNLSSEGWSCNIQPDYVPDTERMTRILTYLKDIRAERVIEDPGAPETYGLDNPSVVLKVGDYVLNFGKASVINNTYYMSMGDGKVYLVENSFYFALTFTREGMAQISDIPAMTDLSTITIENSYGTFTLEQLAGTEKTYSDHYAWFLQGSDQLISQDVVTGVLAYLQDMDWLGCEDANPQNLADYGMETPTVTCTVTWADGSYTFMVGSEFDQGYYAKPADENRIYKLDTTTAQVLGAVSRDMLTCTDVLKMDWDTVTSVEVHMDGTVVTINNCVDEWSISSKAVDAPTVLDAINMMVAEPGTDLKTEGLITELKLVFNRNTESYNPMVLTFYRHDATNCIVQLDDGAPMLVLREDVVLLKEAFNTLILS